MREESYWKRRLSRRRLLAGAATTGAGIAGLVAAGCGGDDEESAATATTAATVGPTNTPAGVHPGTQTPPTPTPENEVIKPGGILNIRQGAPYASISPYRGLDSGLAFGLVTPVYDHLWYTPLDTGVRENFLAETIEQPDPLQFTVTLKQAVFQDKPPTNGRPVLAGDVKASFEAAQASATISKSSWWNDVLDTMDTPDERTVTFNLKSVDAWTFSSTNAGSPIGGSILPIEHATDPSLMEQDLVGSGLFVFVSHSGGTNFFLERNETYRVPDIPRLAGVQWKLIQSQAAALAAFSAQEIDTVVPSNKLEKDQLVKQHGDAIQIDTQLSRGVWRIQPRGDGQWADPRVAKAISLALDKDEMIQLMAFGDGQRSGPIPPTFASYALTEEEIAERWGKFDPAEARRLLEAAGFDMTQQYDVKFIVPGDTFSQFAQICHNQLEKNLGLDLKLVGEDFGKWLGQSLYGSDYNGFMTYPTLAYDDPSSYIGSYTLEIGGRPNWAGFQNEALDALVRQQKATLDDEERQELIRDIQRQAWDVGAPFIPTFVRTTYSAWWGYVKGRVVGRGSYGFLVGTAYIDKG